MASRWCGCRERPWSRRTARRGPKGESLPTLGKGGAGSGDRRPGKDESVARRGPGAPRCCPGSSRRARGVAVSEERLPPNAHRLAGRSLRSPDDAPRRLASEERGATNGERLSERNETSPGRCPWLAGREERREEPSPSASANGEGGSKNDERLPRSGWSLSANDPTSSGQTRGTPRGDRWRNSNAERVSLCHLACAGGEPGVAGNAQRLSGNDASVCAHSPGRAARSPVRPHCNGRVKIKSESRSTKASGVSPHSRTSSPRSSRGSRRRSSGSACSLCLPTFVLGVSLRSSGGTPLVSGGSAHSLSGSRSIESSGRCKKVCRASLRVVPHACRFVCAMTTCFWTA